MASKQKKEKDLEIGISEDIAKGIYSNLVFTAHSQTEFILDFCTLLPAFEKPEIVSRIIMCPENCKKLLYVLADNIEKYEKEMGEIKLDIDNNLEQGSDENMDLDILTNYIPLNKENNS